MNNKKTKIILSFVFTILLFVSNVWSDAEILEDGSCKYDKETGYTNSSLYIKDKESFLIIDGGDSRYGTTSTVYNALTCEEIASGDPIKSDFSGLMRREGFTQTDITSDKFIDKSFQHKITFLENNDELVVSIELIASNITDELNNLLNDISNKNSTPNINISKSAQELLIYKSFYSEVFKKISSLPDTMINYGYVTNLIDKLKLVNINVGVTKDILSSKLEDKNIRIEKLEEEKRQRIARLEEETKRQLARIEEEKNNKMFTSQVKSIKDVPKWINKMIQLGKKDKISKFRQKIMALGDFAANLNPNNFLTSIEYKYVLKYMQLKNISKIQVKDEIYGIKLKYPNKTISLTLASNCKLSDETSTSEFRCGFLFMNKCVGTYAKYNCKGKTSSIAKIENKLVGIDRVASYLKYGWTYKPMISRYTKNDISNTPIGQNMCLGKWTKSYCYSSNLSRSDQNMCMGRWEKSYCYSSNLSRSEQNMCMGRWEKSYCYSSNLSRSEQNMCLGNWKKSYCYSSNLSRSEQNMCLGNWEKSYCYSSDI